jgi:hypothetical protein
METYGGSGYIAPPFLTSALDEVSCQLHAPGASFMEKAPGTPWTGGYVGPRAGPDVAKRKFLAPAGN